MISEVLGDLERAVEEAPGAARAFGEAVASRAARMQATGVSISSQSTSSGARVDFTRVSTKGYAPATVSGKALRPLVEAGQQAMSEAAQ